MKEANSSAPQDVAQLFMFGDLWGRSAVSLEEAMPNVRGLKRFQVCVSGTGRYACFHKVQDGHQYGPCGWPSLLLHQSSSGLQTGGRVTGEFRFANVANPGAQIVTNGQKEVCRCECCNYII